MPVTIQFCKEKKKHKKIIKPLEPKDVCGQVFTTIQ